MTTSGVTTGQMTARDIVTQALTLIGVARPGRVPSAADGILGLTSLNWALKSLQQMGANIWRTQDVTYTVLANTIATTLTPDVIDVISARVVIPNAYERTLARWERGEYADLPNKGVVGSPTCFTFVKETNDSMIRLWPVPYVDMTLTAQVARTIEDVTNLSQTIDLPQEWTETVFYMLADRLIDSFGVAESSPATAQRIAKRAQALLAASLDADRPGSVYMKPFGVRYG